MRLLLQTGLYTTLLTLALGLQCYHFKGHPDRAHQEQEARTCESVHKCCSSSLISYDGLLSGIFLTKGCSTGSKCNHTKTGVIHPQEIDSSEKILCCDTDLCNEDLVPDLGDYPTECLACHGTPEICGGSNLPNLRCGPTQKTCVEVSMSIALGPTPQQIMVKSCSNTSSSSCPGLAAFSNGKQPVSYSSSYRCCTGSQCNRGYFAAEKSGEENGLECYSRSSSQEVAKKMRCRGQMTQCMDMIGAAADQVVMSGCATEAFCHGRYPQFSLPGWRSTVCCSQSLCNLKGSSSSPQGIKH